MRRAPSRVLCSCVNRSTLTAKRNGMYCFVKTHNPRPTFHFDMTPEERSIMEKHIAYWSDKAEKGIAIVFGPVMDPAGVYGVGIYQVKDEQEMQELIDGDPALGLLEYNVFPMPRAVIGKDFRP